MTAETTLPLTIKAGFGCGQIAGQIFRDTPSLLLLFYLTNVIGIEPIAAGTAIFFPKVFWSVMSDFGVGILADRMNARFPRRHWLLIGAVAAPLAMVLIFRVPDGSTTLRIAYVTVTFSLYMMAFATFSVPYLSQFSEITEDPTERTVLMAWRHAFTGVGLLLGSALTPVMIHRLGGNRSAYETVSLGLGAICALSLLSAHRAASKIVTRARSPAKVSLAGLFGVIKHRRFTTLLTAAFMQETGAGISYASIAYFLTYNMGRADALAQLGFMTMITAAVVIMGSPFWVFVSRYLGKKNTYLLAATLHALVQCAWGLSTPATPISVLYLFGAMLGLMNSGWGIMILAMLGDMIADAKVETGQDRAASFSAMWALVEKLSLALGGTLIVGIILSGFGFSAAANLHGIRQPATALTGIAFAFAFAPSLLNVMAALFFWRFGRPNEPTRRMSVSPTLAKVNS